MAEEEIINNFLEQLETLGIEINIKINEITNSEEEIIYLESLIKMSFESIVSYYLSLTKKERTIFNNLLLRIFKDKELVDSIIKEIMTFGKYPPKYQDILKKSLKDYYYKSKKKYSEKEKKRLEDNIDRIVSLGTAFEDKRQLTMIDIDTLEEVLQIISMKEEDKEIIIFYAINQNNNVYERNIRNKQEGKIIEVDVEDEEGIDHSRDNKVLNKLDKLLNDAETKERIVLIINKNIKTLNITEELVNQSVDTVREIIINRIKHNQELTPEKALDEFFKLNELSTNNKTEILRGILKDSEKSNLNKRNQQEQLLKALVFYEENKKLLKQLSNEKKTIVNEYIQSVFSSIRNRELVYRNESQTSNEEVIKIAAYEIEILKDLMNAVSEAEDDYSSLISKLSKRFEDILRCVNEYQNPICIEEDQSGTLFFLMKNNSETYFESDLRKKSITKNYYEEISKLLANIEDRNRKRYKPIKPVNTTLKGMRKHGVLYINGTYINIFYIPIGKKDSIIVGLSCIEDKKHINSQELRIREEDTNINILKGRIKELNKEEMFRQNHVRERIIRVIE